VGRGFWLLHPLVAGAAYRLARPKPKETPQATVNPATVEVEATTGSEAIRVGLLALNLTRSDDVVIKILQTSRKSLLGTDTRRECASRGDSSRTA